MTAAICIAGVEKTFALAEHGGHVSLREALRMGARQVRALQDITIDIRSGERVGIIGRNGAGKTTLLSLLAGLAEPTSGSIKVQGGVHAMLTVGAVLRNEATGRENIFLDG